MKVKSNLKSSKFLDLNQFYSANSIKVANTVTTTNEYCNGGEQVRLCDELNWTVGKSWFDQIIAGEVKEEYFSRIISFILIEKAKSASKIFPPGN